MPRERVDVGHELGLARRRGHAADAAAEGDGLAGHFALEGAENEVWVVWRGQRVEGVEACPVDGGGGGREGVQGVPEKGGGVGEVAVTEGEGTGG